ncbi:MraY family glycosyltransferase [Neorhodopirellula pilleata]|uniref:MraY family glycosyltransferase n=1 Tax=Neorhodopirellula pilleata TaxID=2714738 RepID=UPI001E5320FB|nr:MraY family glycosyltransferase [Neorhodopirellula pilleata]
MFTLITAFVSALLFVPVVRFLAIRINLVDQPDAERKLHSRPIALAGGVAVFASMLVAMVFTLGYQNGWSLSGISELFTYRWKVLLGSSCAILLLGLIDDAFTLRGRQKLLAQCLIAMVIVGSGSVMKQIGILGYDLPLGVFAIPISVLWLLIAINALNLLDGADGMATTVGMFVTGSLAIMGMINGGLSLNSIAAFALCGALAGFLVFNRPPATIFLGDAGSMMIGLIVGVLAMWCSLKGTTVVAAAPIAILILPLFDSTAAIMRRWLTGRSIYATDRGHLHHLLNDRFGRAGTLWVVAAACSISSAAAIASIAWGYDLMTPVGALVVLAILVGTRTFGYSECRLLAGRVRHLVKSFLVRPHVCDVEKHERSLKMQGDGPWQEIWEPLIDFALKEELASVKIDVNMAWLHQSYHATWRSVRLPEKAFQNVVRIPLFASRGSGDRFERVPIGRLEVIAASTDSALERLRDFLDHAGELQTQIEGVVARLEAAAAELKRIAAVESAVKADAKVSQKNASKQRAASPKSASQEAELFELSDSETASQSR